MIVRVIGVVRLNDTVVGSPRVPHCEQYEFLRSPSAGDQGMSTPGGDTHSIGIQSAEQCDGPPNNGAAYANLSDARMCAGVYDPSRTTT